MIWQTTESRVNRNPHLHPHDDQKTPLSFRRNERQKIVYCHSCLKSKIMKMTVREPRSSPGLRTCETSNPLFIFFSQHLYCLSSARHFPSLPPSASADSDPQKISLISNYDLRPRLQNDHQLLHRTRLDASLFSEALMIILIHQKRETWGSDLDCFSLKRVIEKKIMLYFWNDRQKMFQEHFSFWGTE